MSKMITHYVDFEFLLPSNCLLPPYDQDPKWAFVICVQVFYTTQHPSSAQLFDYRINVKDAEKVYWPMVNEIAPQAVSNNCATHWELLKGKNKSS